jgi:DNA-binding NarL/FixJ family response regulator
MIRIAICDDHQIVRAGFKQILNEVDDIEVVAEASTGREALDLVRKGNADLIKNIRTKRPIASQRSSSIKRAQSP